MKEYNMNYKPSASKAPKVGAGRTAPRLFADLKEVDWYRVNHNIICDSPANLCRAGAIPPAYHEHELVYVTQDPQSYLYKIPTDSQTVYALCRHCKISFLIEQKLHPNKQKRKWCGKPETAKQYPTHHYVFQENDAESLHTFYGERCLTRADWIDRRVFVCSAPECGQTIVITSRPPRLTKEMHDGLISDEMRRRRLERAIGECPEIPKDSEPQPAIEIINCLMFYLRNIVFARRAIPARNKRFLQTVGEPGPGHEILTKFGYTVVEKLTGEESGTIEFNYEVDMAKVGSKEGAQAVEALITEVAIILNELSEQLEPGDERLKYKVVLSNAENHIRRLLGCENKNTKDFDVNAGSQSRPFDLTSEDYSGTSRKPIDLTRLDTPSYRGLGVAANSPDTLINWAFNRQSACDPANTPLYYECLGKIANERNSEDLQFQIAILMSREPMYTETEVIAAYKAFNQAPGAPPDLLLACFRNNLLTSPETAPQLSSNLKIIGTVKKNNDLIRAADNVVTDLNGAYRFFGIGADTDDTFVNTMYQLKISDSPNETANAKIALRIIAEARNSTLLKTVLQINRTEIDLSLVEAYDVLGSSAALADETLATNYENLSIAFPGKSDELLSALHTIGNSRKSDYLVNYRIGMPTQSYFPKPPPVPVDTTVQRRPENWPVGLENIGNTCYLNSLLQFYFTIKPLRDVVLQFDQYRETEITDELLERKRVGGRKLTRAEIERANKFVIELRRLFESLVSSEHSSITPEKELAYLALVSSRDEEQAEAAKKTPVIEIIKDDATTLVHNSPEPGQMDLDAALITESQVDKLAQNGTSEDGSDSTIVNSKSIQPNEAEEGASRAITVDEDYAMLDDASDATLMGDSPPSFEDDLVSETSLEDNSHPLGARLLRKSFSPPSSGMRSPDLNSSGKRPLSLTILDGDDTVEGTRSSPIVIDQPPPVPPRPSKQTVTVGSDAMLFGRQQDVTECIENVMFQLEAAMKSDRTGDNGEQLDVVKDLFYGTTKQYLEVPGSSRREKTEYFSHLIVDVATGNRDIYSALDAIFDVSMVDLEGQEARRYVSVSELPPVLQVQVQRVQFNRETGSAYKSTAQLAFPETIYMDRYLDSSNKNIMNRREESWKWKAEIAKLENRKEELEKSTIPNETVKDVLNATASYLEAIQEEFDDSIKVEPSLPIRIEEAASKIGPEIEEIEAEIKGYQSRLAQQFTDLRSAPYRIHSVFIHRGSASSGHYWIYIYDFKAEIWRKYNDGYVTIVDDISEVMDGKNEATPYLLVYVKDDSIAETVEAVGKKGTTPKKRRIE